MGIFMKQRIFSGCLLAFFFLMLFFPAQVLNGASNGLLLWFNVVLPTLLPFMILSNLMIHTHALNWISRISAPFLCPLFRISSYGSFALLTGFLCGYPMGAKVTSDLLKGKYLSQKEAAYLLSFCNNTSPMFLVSFVILQNLKETAFTIPALAIIILSPILSSLLFRRYYRITSNQNSSLSMPSLSFTKHNLIDSCIMDGFEAITKVGGYIMLFSILINLSQLFPGNHLVFYNLLVPSLELTNGIVLICSSCCSIQKKLFYSLILTSFGGWCCIAQTRSMMQGSNIPILPYITEKLITASVTSLLTYCYLFFI